MRSHNTAQLVAAGLLFAVLMSARAEQPVKQAKNTMPLEALQAKIDALKAPNVAWRQIAWKNCLLEGLRESGAKSKPALLWVFIDRPIDDARC
jgi:hypothetical protein